MTNITTSVSSIQKGINMEVIYYIYKGVIVDTKDEWLNIIGDNEFNMLLESGQLIQMGVSAACQKY